MEMARREWSFWRRARHQLDRMGHTAAHLGLWAVTSPGVFLWNKILHGPLKGQGREVRRVMQGRFRDLLARDVANVASGVYPRGLLFQFPFLPYLLLAPYAMTEMPLVYWRKQRGRYDALPATVERSAYPAYYLRNFHWQTDGWFSDRSARIYDIGVEFLFMGTADIMRRMALAGALERLPRGGSILDLACGTGRFLLQARRARPDIQLAGLDLSPNYLGYARRLLKGKDVTLIEGNAEATTLEEGGYDVTTSVFLFHELPKDARRRVMAEAYRLTKPGGRFVICDSLQHAGNEGLEAFLERFPSVYHEPYYGSYLRDDLALALEETGFRCLSDEQHLVSRVIVAQRPR